jgi:hypothetical protein
MTPPGWIMNSVAKSRLRIVPRFVLPVYLPFRYKAALFMTQAVQPDSGL